MGSTGQKRFVTLSGFGKLTCLKPIAKRNGHSRPMLSTDSLLSTTEPFDVKPGEMLIERGQRAPYVLHVDRGRVALGLLQGGRIEHRLGTVSGPAWLDASSTVLGRASVVDAVADGPLTARRVSGASFHGAVMALTPTVRKMLHDLAIAHRQQTDKAGSHDRKTIAVLVSRHKSWSSRIRKTAAPLASLPVAQIRQQDGSGACYTLSARESSLRQAIMAGNSRRAATTVGVVACGPIRPRPLPGDAACIAFSSDSCRPRPRRC